jgi:hypothetical protein
VSKAVRGTIKRQLLHEEKNIPYKNGYGKKKRALDEDAIDDEKTKMRL